LHKRAKEAATAEGISLVGFIRRAVIKYLESIGK
jgi:predicted HicB family RNase H-like nuclease